MNDQAIKLLATALRSGDYTQTTGELQNECGHCVLGVLCEVYEKATGLKAHRYGPSEHLVGQSLHAQQNVYEWSGLTNHTGTTTPTGAGLHPPCLAVMNDSGEMDFNQLADFIESKPPGLFKE